MPSSEFVTKVMDLLGRLSRQLYKKEDFYRSKSFQKAVHTLYEHAETIQKPEDCRGLPGIGAGIMRRIDEIWKMGNVKELTPPLPFEGVPGLGPKMRLFLKEEFPHLKTVVQLRKALEEEELTLPKAVHVGLEFYDRLERRIPRDDVTKVHRSMEKAIRKLSPGTEVYFCGSYRREKMECGDIDVLLINANENPPGSFLLREVVRSLTASGFLVGHLTHQLEELKTKYMGFCVSKNMAVVALSKVYRIDIRHVPMSAKATALLYFTGSGWFNRVMRLRAKTMGFVLNEYGLWDRKQKKRVAGLRTEQDVFRALKMEYRTPSER